MAQDTLCDNLEVSGGASQGSRATGVCAMVERMSMIVMMEEIGFEKINPTADETDSSEKGRLIFVWIQASEDQMTQIRSNQ